MIKLRNVVKSFDERTAINDLSLSVNSGEVFGLLGPNGAGKTTLIRLVMMLLKPTAGQIMINGLDISRDAQEVKALIGLVPQHINLDPDLTVRQNLDLHGRLYHMPAAQRRAGIDELLEYVELAERADDYVQSLSGGMKRRLLIARALMHRPRLLLLDEPTVALDPQVRRKLWDLIRRMHNDNITVLLTTHYIEEAEVLCDRVAVVDKGRLIALDTPRELCRKVGEYVVEWESERRRETAFFDQRRAAADFAGKLTEAATIRRTNLEDVFIELTGRKVNG